MSMTYKQAREYLQPVADNHPVTGYAVALTTAIRALEEVDQLKEHLRSSTDRCKFCANAKKPRLCEDSDYFCNECFQNDCICRDCDHGSKWEWRGVKEG